MAKLVWLETTHGSYGVGNPSKKLCSSLRKNLSTEYTLPDVEGAFGWKMFARVVCFRSSLILHSNLVSSPPRCPLRSAMNARPGAITSQFAKSAPRRSRGSFGGMNQSKSAFHAREHDYQTSQAFTSADNVAAIADNQKKELSGGGRVFSSSFMRSDQVPGLSVDTLGTASGEQRQEDFPELIGANRSSSSSTTLMDSNVPRMLQQEHALESASNNSDAFPIVQTEHQFSLDSSGHKMQTSINSGSSRKLHIEAGGDNDCDDWEPQPRRGERTSSQGKSEKGFRDNLKSGNSRTVGNKDRIYYLGRLMTSILRHRAAKLNLSIRNDGYVAVKDLLKLGLKTQAGLPLSIYSVEDICKAVEQDNKQRFGLLTENGVLFVRANQGHSMKIVETEKLLKPITSADEISVCVHGTFMRNIDSILQNGLSKMGRNHVHFASGLPHEDGIISGMKSHCEVLIYLNVEKALQDGIKLYMSENGVILTEGFDGVVPRKYFSQVALWKKGKIIPMVTDSQC